MNMTEKLDDIMDDINVTIDPNLAKFAAECGTESFKAYLNYVDKKTSQKYELLSKRLDLEKSRMEYNVQEREAFYDALSRMCSDVVNYLNLPNK